MEGGRPPDHLGGRRGEGGEGGIGGYKLMVNSQSLFQSATLTNDKVIDV